MLKHLVDQKGHEVKFGDVVHYSESVNEKNYKSFFDIHVTLTPENLEKLKLLGAVKEVEMKELSIDDYNTRIAELLCESDKDKFIERFRSCFPAQYLSVLITLIHDDIDDDKNLKDSGYIFDLSSGVMRKVDINKKTPIGYVNIFSSPSTRDVCLNVIKPFIDRMYK